MRRLLITTILLLTVTILYPQERVGLIEAEASLGLVGGKSHTPFAESKAGSASAEVRVNLPQSPFDVGLQLSVVRYGREQQLFRHEHTTLFADYNYRKWQAIDLFAGIGLGYGEVVGKHTEASIGDSSSYYGNHLVVAPRVGVEFYGVVRLTLDGKILSKGKTFVGATVGVVLGGWRRNR